MPVCRQGMYGGRMAEEEKVENRECVAVECGARSRRQERGWKIEEPGTRTTYYHCGTVSCLQPPKGKLNRHRRDVRRACPSCASCVAARARSPWHYRCKRNCTASSPEHYFHKSPCAMKMKMQLQLHALVYVDRYYVVNRDINTLYHQMVLITSINSTFVQ
jgi:hypothetical protein